MGAVLSTFGFNQPFFITLVGIILLLMLTLALVTDSEGEGEEGDNSAYPEQRPLSKTNLTRPLGGGVVRVIRRNCTTITSSPQLSSDEPARSPLLLTSSSYNATRPSSSTDII